MRLCAGGNAASNNSNITIMPMVEFVFDTASAASIGIHLLEYRWSPSPYGEVRPGVRHSHADGTIHARRIYILFIVHESWPDAPINTSWKHC